jgi:hypothetical protein
MDQRLDIPKGNKKSHFGLRRFLNDPAWTSTRGFGGSTPFVVSEPDSVCIFQVARVGKNTLIYNKVISEASCRDRQRKTEC